MFCWSRLETWSPEESTNYYTITYPLRGSRLPLQDKVQERSYMRSLPILALMVLSLVNCHRNLGPLPLKRRLALCSLAIAICFVSSPNDCNAFESLPVLLNRTTASAS